MIVPRPGLETLGRGCACVYGSPEQFSPPYIKGKNKYSSWRVNQMGRWKECSSHNFRGARVLIADKLPGGGLEGEGKE